MEPTTTPDRDRAVLVLIRRAPVGAFPRSPEVLYVEADPGESNQSLALRVRRTLRKLSPDDRARTGLRWLRR